MSASGGRTCPFPRPRTAPEDAAGLRALAFGYMGYVVCGTAFGRRKRRMAAVYRCPVCHHESAALSSGEREIVACYCLRHRSGIDGHVQPVEMVLCPAPDPAEIAGAEILREPVPVG
jgi:hypothetical protein